MKESSGSAGDVILFLHSDATAEVLAKCYSGTHHTAPYALGVVLETPADRLILQVRPLLAVSVVKSTKNQNRRIVKCTRLPSNGATAHELTTANGTAAYELSDVTELQDRRQQLQRDVDTSRRRMEEIDLYRSHRAEEASDSERRRHVKVIDAEKELFLSRAAIRATRPHVWEELTVQLEKEDSSLPDALRVLLTATAVLLGCRTPQDLVAFPDLASSIAAVRVDAVPPAAIAKAAATLRGTSQSALPSNVPLCWLILRWLQALVCIAEAHKASQTRPRTADMATVTFSSEHHENNTVAETSELAHEQERKEHEEYVQVATEELDALDEILTEMQAKCPINFSTDLRNLPPLDISPQQILARFMHAEMEELLTTAADAPPGGHVKLGLAISKRILPLIGAPLAGSRLASQTSLSKGSALTKNTVLRTGAAGAHVATDVRPLPTHRLTENLSPKAPLPMRHASRRAEVAKLPDSQRRATPQDGSALLCEGREATSSCALDTLRTSLWKEGTLAVKAKNDSTATHPTANPNKSSLKTVCDGKPNSTPQQSQPRASITEDRACSQNAAASHGGPPSQVKETQLLREELQAMVTELKRVKEDRDRLLTERRDRSHRQDSSRLRRLSGARGDDYCGESANMSRQSDRAVVEDLEEQLTLSYQRIAALEHGKKNAGGSMCTAPADSNDLLFHGEGSCRLRSAQDFPAPGHAAEARQELVRQVESLQKDLREQQQSNCDLSERLNSAIHAHNQSQQSVQDLTKELHTMWTKLVETESRLNEEVELSTCADSITMRRAANQWSLAIPPPETPPHPPHHELEPSDGKPCNASLDHQPAEGLSKVLSPVHVVLDPRGSSPPTATSLQRLDPALGATSPSIAATGSHYQQAVGHMNPRELRHEVLQLREEVDRLKSTELRLATELETTREELRDERRNRQRTRTVRLQMLSRLQDAVQEAMEGQSASLGELPEAMERTREYSKMLRNRSMLTS